VPKRLLWRCDQMLQALHRYSSKEAVPNLDKRQRNHLAAQAMHHGLQRCLGAILGCSIDKVDHAVLQRGALLLQSQTESGVRACVEHSTSCTFLHRITDPNTMHKGPRSALDIVEDMTMDRLLMLLCT